MIARTSSTRTRRGGSCLKDIYKTFLIYRTCMRRAPAKPVRACTLQKWCPVAHFTCEAPLRTSHFSLHSSHSTLHTALFTLHTAFFALHTSHLKLHSPHFSLLTAYFTLHTSHCALHTALFTLHTELLLPYPRSLHLMCHLSFHESPPSTATKELACTVRQPGACVRAFCESRVLLHFSHLKLHFALHTSHCTLFTLHAAIFALFTLHTALFTLHPSQSTLHFTLYS